ncbi:MAG: nucleotide exchange factor GrpE [Spirochaetia bacterium]|nr:nucleotide exchange factor GrpE [Spirochaetia bacterium]
MTEEIKEQKKMNETEQKEGNQPEKETPQEILEGVDIADGKVHAEKAEESKNHADDGKSDSDGDEIQKLKKEVESMKDAWTRERAEFMNYKKRVAQEQARYRTEIISDFAKNLFPVVDNLERVMQVENPDETLKNFLSGVEMIQKDFMSVFEKERILPLNPVDEEFDPYKMEAIAIENREGIEKDTVMEVFQCGYIYDRDEGDVKVLRPARVKVAKKS